MYFDARAAKQLQPGGHIVVQGCAGLRLVASAVTKTWVYRYKSPLDGRMRQIKLGAWPALALPGAVAKWQDLKTRRDAGADPAADKKAARLAKTAGVYTVARLVADYVAGHLKINRQPSGSKAIESRLLAATAQLAKLAAAGVTRRAAFDTIAALSDRPVLAKSVRNELGSAWGLALDAGRLPENTPNWWRQIMPGKLRSKGAVRDGQHKGTDKRTLTAPELAALLSTDMPRFSQQVQDFLIVQLWTCTRGAEIVQMRREHISTEADGVWWTCPKAMTKNARRSAATDLRVPLIGRALAVVQRLMATDGPPWLFASTSRADVVGPQKQTYMQSKVNYLQPYCKSRPDHVRERLAVTHWSPHDLRRTGRTMLAQLGCPNEVAESILGHTRPGVQGVYDRYSYDAERRLWLGRWADALENMKDMPLAQC